MCECTTHIHVHACMHIFAISPGMQKVYSLQYLDLCHNNITDVSTQCTLQGLFQGSQGVLSPPKELACPSF